MSELRQSIRVGTLADGSSVVVVDAQIPEDAPETIREGMARRAIVNGGGRCPCGAVVTWPNRAARRAAVKAGRVVRVAVEHEDGCPAVTETLEPAIDAWLRGGR